MQRHAIDDALISRLLNGDRRAHNKIYHILEASLKSFAQRYMPKNEDASDIVQETMLEVWRSVDKFKGQSSFKTWIFSIAKNKAIDCARKASRFGNNDIYFEVVDEADDPFKTLEKNQNAMAIQTFMKDLKPAQKTVIELAFFRDMTYTEIAALESCPLGTVKTRIFAAKSVLRRRLEQS